MGATVLGWLLLVGVLRLFVLAPEQCTPASPAEVDRAIERAVSWFEQNQLADGRFVYAYQRGDEVDLTTQLVRHHGVVVSLYQAGGQGFEGAFETAEDALTWSLDHLVDTGDRSRAVGFADQTIPIGATALLIAALVERDRIVGQDEHDELLADLGRFLLANVTDEGEVSATWSPDAGPVGDRSLFFTGEVMWTLSLLAEASPPGDVSADEWAETARLIGHHIALDRDRVEKRIALTPDHWSGYGVDQIRAVAGASTDVEIAHARRTAGLISVRVRLESQNPDSGPVRWTRGAHSLGAGVGTLGEGLGGVIRLAERDDRLADLREPMRETMACVAGLLVERQLTADDVGPADDPALVVGAWFRNGRTQQDDQQHALSALLAARLVLDGTEDRARNVDHDDAGGWIVLALILLLAADPVRARVARSRSAVGSADRRSSRAPPWIPRQALMFAVVAGPVAGLAARLLDAAELSEPTVRLAAGLVIMVTAGSDLLAPERTGSSLWRPGPFVALLAGGADPGVAGALVAVLVTTLVVAGAELAGTTRGRDGREGTDASGWSPRRRQVSRFVAAGALVLGADFAVDGVFEL